MGKENDTSEDRLNRVSNDHVQQGIDRYPDVLYSVDSTGIQGVSSSAWFPMMKVLSLRKALLEQIGRVGSKDTT